MIDLYADHLPKRRFIAANAEPALKLKCVSADLTMALFLVDEEITITAAAESNLLLQFSAGIVPDHLTRDRLLSANTTIIARNCAYYSSVESYHRHELYRVLYGGSDQCFDIVVHRRRGSARKIYRYDSTISSQLYSPALLFNPYRFSPGETFLAVLRTSHIGADTITGSRCAFTVYDINMRTTLFTVTCVYNNGTYIEVLANRVTTIDEMRLELARVIHDITKISVDHDDLMMYMLLTGSRQLPRVTNALVGFTKANRVIGNKLHPTRYGPGKLSDADHKHAIMFIEEHEIAPTYVPLVFDIGYVVGTEG